MSERATTDRAPSAHRDSRFGRKPANGCSGCGQDFGSVSLFDRHRVGSFEPLERRCLSIEEMCTRGWELDGRGRWVDPAKVEQARKAFSALNSPSESPAEAEEEEEAA